MYGNSRYQIVYYFIIQYSIRTSPWGVEAVEGNCGSLPISICVMRPFPLSRGACHETWSPGSNMLAEVNTYFANCCIIFAGHVGGVVSPLSRTSRKVSSKPNPLGRPGPVLGWSLPSPWRSDNPKLQNIIIIVLLIINKLNSWN